jgi:hypothetical protein
MMGHSNHNPLYLHQDRCTDLDAIDVVEEDVCKVQMRSIGGGFAHWSLAKGRFPAHVSRRLRLMSSDNAMQLKLGILKGLLP